MSRVRLFVIYDREYDADLGALLRTQAKRPESSFEILAGEHGGSSREGHDERVRAAIAAVDEVVVICGEHTRESLRVASEFTIAREESKPYLLLWGRRERMCTKPDGSSADDAMYSWTPEILERQIAWVLRSSKPTPIPESCKRVVEVAKAK